MSFLRIPALAFSALCIALLSAPVSANSNHTVSWKTYQTAHFEILYHDDIAPQARVARDFMEGAYAKIKADLGMRERGILITVVLTGVPDESNGYATPLGHKMVIYTRPMQVLASNDIAWLKRVLAHELTHQVTFLTLRKSFLGIYSEIYKSQSLPAWFMEGLAQYESETWDAKRNTFFAHALYNSALESYPDMATYTKTDPVSGRLVYEQGHAFVRFLATRLGPGGFPKLLSRIRVIPVWNEIKALLSPLTRSILPLEGVLKARTGVGIRQLYAEFTDSLRAGLPPAAALAGPLKGGVPGFAVVYQMKLLDSSAFLFTGQEAWDQARVALYESRNGSVRRLAADPVNPVFDVSPDGKRVAYVRTFTDVNGDPRERLYVAGVAGGDETVVSDGAAHPAFLANDTLAYSHYAHGRQALAICAPGGRGWACTETAPDTLTGFFALSKSTHGLLLNATDTAGRTGVYEYAPATGFVPVYRDTVPAEFPVETADGAVLLLRERRGLLQVDALDRASGRIVPAATYPLGTFYLHRAAPGMAASVAQVGDRGHWGLEPVAIAPPAMAKTDADAGAKANAGAGPVAGESADSAAARHASVSDSAHAKGADSGAVTRASAPRDTVLPDSTLRISTARDTLSSHILKSDSLSSDTLTVYRKPGFLVTNEPEFPPKGKPRKAAPQEYNSLLGIRPLLAYPAFTATPGGGSVGAGVLLQDPLELHTLSAMCGIAPDKAVYGVEYLNQQTPLGLSLSATNAVLELDKLVPPPGWEKAYLAATADVFSAGIQIPFPAPANTAFMLGARGSLYYREYRVAGQAVDSNYKLLEGWSKRRTDTEVQAFFGARYLAPYAYAMVHPLWLFDLEAGGLSRTFGPEAFYYARGTFPIHGELTFTARWQGEILAYEPHVDEADLPDGQSTLYAWGGRSGIIHDGYAGVDFPLYKGYIGEVPLFGLWNYLGGGVFGSFYRRTYDYQLDDAGYEFFASEREEIVAGAKLTGLFHIMRRFPLALSFQCGYDVRSRNADFRLTTELAGIPSTVSLKPDFKPGLGNARRRGP